MRHVQTASSAASMASASTPTSQARTRRRATARTSTTMAAPQARFSRKSRRRSAGSAPPPPQQHPRAACPGVRRRGEGALCREVLWDARRHRRNRRPKHRQRKEDVEAQPGSDASSDISAEFWGGVTGPRVSDALWVISAVVGPSYAIGSAFFLLGGVSSLFPGYEEEEWSTLKVDLLVNVPYLVHRSLKTPAAPPPKKDRRRLTTACSLQEAPGAHGRASAPTDGGAAGRRSARSFTCSAPTPRCSRPPTSTIAAICAAGRS